MTSSGDAQDETETDKYQVPNVIGMSLSQAKEAIGDNLKIETTTEASSSYKEGLVIRQSLESDAEVDKGETITLTVSSGSEQVTVPNLSYYTESEARRQLSNMGLTLGSVTRKYDSSVERNQVISQSIASGTKVSKGTAVGITVSLGSRPSTTTSSSEDEPDEEEPDENE